MAWSVEQRAELREAFEQSRRDALVESRRLAAIKPPASVEPTPRRVVAPPPPAPKPEIPKTRRGVSHCIFCGGPTRNWADVCRAHADLLEVA